MNVFKSSKYPHVTDVSLGDLVEITGGTLRLAAMPPRDGDLSPIERIVTNPCDVEEGDVYWAVPQSTFATSADSKNQSCRCDADFALEAMMRGAAGVVSSRHVEPMAGRWSIEVADPLVALWELARAKRDRATSSVITITGAVGKSTAAAMIDCVLRTRLAGIAECDAADSRVDVPLALAATDAHDDYAVLEIAETNSHQADALARLCRPRLAVVLNLHDGDEAALAPLTALSPDGVAVMCGDEPALRRAASRTVGKTVWFGRSGDCDYSAINVEYRQGRLTFDVEGVTLRLPIWGRHYLHAALAAYAACRTLGFSPQEIAHALAAFRQPPDRCEVSHADGVTLIHDAHAVEPQSFGSALALLRETPADGRRIVVCGEVRSMNTPDRTQYREYGDHVVSRCAADRLVACGPHARDVVTGAHDAGMPLGHAVACRDLAEAASYLATEQQPGDVVLFKGAPREAVKKAMDGWKRVNAPLRRAA